MNGVVRKIRNIFLFAYAIYLAILSVFAYIYYTGGNTEKVIPVFITLFTIILLGTGILVQIQLRNLLNEENKLYDKLTGTYKREVIEEILFKQIELAKRNKKEFSVMLIDIDGLRNINGTLGRMAVEKILKDIAFLIRKNLRRSDVVGRWNKDQFVVILPETSLEGANKVAKKLLWKVKDYYEGSHNYSPTISVGITKYENMDSIEKIVYKLENALWNAKSNGKTKVEKFLFHDLTKKTHKPS